LNDERSNVSVSARTLTVSRSTGGELSLTTKGDNNGTADEAAILPEQIQGTVWYSVPWIGYLNNAVGGGGKTWLVIGLAVLLFAYAGWQFIGGLFDRRGRKGEDATADNSPASTS